MKIELGQIMQLRSSGPNMTVVSYSEKPTKVYKCSWFTPDAVYNWADFEEHELTPFSSHLGFKTKEVPDANKL